MSAGFRIASRWSIAAVVLVAAMAAVVMTRRPSQPPIRADGTTLTIENQTDREWRNVVVTVNAYYRGQTPSLAPGGRIDVRLATLMTGLGQYFNPARESVKTVQLRATDASGQPVAIDWTDRK